MRNVRLVMWRLSSVLLLALQLTACASSIVPSELAGQVNRDVTGAVLNQDPDRYRGQTVLVGGEVVAVRNVPGESELEILERPLSSSEMPMVTISTAGHIVVRYADYLDPSIYAAGQRVTVVGAVVGAVERKVGDTESRCALLQARSTKLWSGAASAQSYPYGVFQYLPFGAFPLAP